MKFEDLRLSPALLRAIAEMGFTNPTPVQYAAIPLLLQGSDVIAQAQTGTGKTAAFALSILQTLQPNGKVQALVLVPTRELAVQVVAEFRDLGKHAPQKVLAVYGGEDIERQIRALHQGVDVVVGTPGRIMDHLERRTLHLADVKFVVLDEADRMLDMGFIDDVRFIMKHMPPQKQTALFSATMPETIMELARTTMVQPEQVRVSEDKVTAENIRQHYMTVDGRDKLYALCTLLQERKPQLSIVFCRTKRGADTLHYALRDKGFDNVCLHGDLTQSRRDRAMQSLRNNKASLLVATDIAARGLDIDDVQLVVNYNLPDEPEVYVHRIGRTARAGKEGDAVTFVTNLMERRQLDDMVARSRSTISELPLSIDQKFRSMGRGTRPFGGGHESHDRPRGGFGQGGFRGSGGFRSQGGNRPHHGGDRRGGPRPHGGGHGHSQRPSQSMPHMPPAPSGEQAPVVVRHPHNKGKPKGMFS